MGWGGGVVGGVASQWGGAVVSPPLPTHMRDNDSFFHIIAKTFDFFFFKELEHFQFLISLRHQIDTRRKKKASIKSFETSIDERRKI